MRVTCIIILIILQTTHNILHIPYHIVHIILSYAMRPWNHRLDIRTSQNEGSTYGASNKEPSLTNIESASFIHTYFIFILSYTSATTSYTQDVVQDSHRVRCAMTKNNIVSLLKSSLPLDYPILTPLLSFISLCALLEAGLILPLETLTLTPQIM